MEMKTILVLLVLGILVKEIVADAICGKYGKWAKCWLKMAPTCRSRISPERPETCTPGCYCKDLYVREKLNGTCIMVLDCKDVCTENERFDMCGSRCPATCKYRKRPCINTCAAGCYCKEGFVLDDEHQICIPEEDCPK